MNILMLNTYDRGGGAERITLDLYNAYRRRGHDVKVLVRFRLSLCEDVTEIDPYTSTSFWAPFCAGIERGIARLPRFRGQYRVRDWMRRSAFPVRWLNRWKGIEDFDYPSSHNLLTDPKWQPDLVHAHNLHGDYFDLRALASLSQRIPVVWTLHDTWAFTGHCAYFVECQRWREGCERCPDLRRSPAILRDRAAQNWECKRRIYSNSRLAIVTPSRWLMNHVDQSILRPWRKRVIPNGVDLAVFHTKDRRDARAFLGLPQDVFIALFIAQSGSGTNPYKDYRTVDQAIRQVITVDPGTKILFLCIGGEQRAASDPRFRFVGHLTDPSRVAMYFQAADVLLHAANAENFPCVVLEALASATPVVATAVGGIPEQVVDGENGFLVPRGDSDLMAQRVLTLMGRPDLLRHMGRIAAASVQHLSLHQQSSTYLQWFEELSAEYYSSGG